MFCLNGWSSTKSTAAKVSDMSISSSGSNSIQYIKPQQLHTGVSTTPQLNRQEDYPSDKENCQLVTPLLRAVRLNNNNNNNSDIDCLYKVD